MADIQFEVITDLTVLNPQHIETNFEAVDAYLTEAMEPYTQMVVTEDSIGDAKKTLAQLRKIKESINAQKIAVKREWMKPYTEYEDKAKQLMGRVEKGISNLDGQLKDYDARRKEEKLAALELYFREEAEKAGVSDYMDWTRVKNIRWSNATYQIEEAKGDISEAISRCAGDLKILRDMESPFETAMLDEYRNNGNDLRAAISAEKRLRTLQEAEERKRAQTVTETFREEENAADGFDAPVEPEQPQFIRPMAEEAPPRPKTYTLDFRVVVTMQQAHALKAFFSEQGIEYHKI